MPLIFEMKFLREVTKNKYFRKVGIPVYQQTVRRITWLPVPRVIVISMPKAGTHLILRVLGLLPKMVYSGRHLDEHDLFESQDYTENSHLAIDKLEDMISACRDGQYFSGHFPYHTAIERTLGQHEVVPLVIIRDPRDVAVSYVNYVSSEPRHYHHRLYTEKYTNFDDRLMATLAGFSADKKYTERGLVPMYTHICSYLPWLNSDLAITFRFEQLVGPSGGGGVEQQRDAISTIAKSVNRRLDEEQLEAIRSKAFSTSSRTFHKGQSGGWSCKFNDSHKEFCKRYLDDAIVRLGYAAT